MRRLVGAVCALAAPVAGVVAVALAFVPADRLPQVAKGGDALSVAFADAKETISAAMVQKADSYFHGGIDMDCHAAHGHGHEQEPDHDECHHGHCNPPEMAGLDPWRWINSHVRAPERHVHLDGEKSAETLPWFWAAVRADPVYNTQYETFGVRRVRNDPRHFRAQTVFGEGVAEMHVSVAWENYAGRLPPDGGEWEFEALRWGGPNGKSAWNGTESIHGRSTWGRLKFRLPASARCAIRRRQINLAAAAYRREKTIEQHYDGVFSWWRDPYVGDVAFYEKSLAPLVARLDGLVERAKPEMSDAEVEAFSAADLSALVDVKFEVARRRRDWLESKTIAGEGR